MQNDSYDIPLLYKLILKEKYKSNLSKQKFKVTWTNDVVSDIDTKILSDLDIDYDINVDNDYKHINLLITSYNYKKQGTDKLPIIMIIDTKKKLNEPYVLLVTSYSVHKSYTEDKEYIVIPNDNSNINH